MNDAYPPGHPRYASRVQLGQDGDAPDAGQRDNATEEDQMEAEPALPSCTGKNGVQGVDCIKTKPLKLCPGNQEPKKQDGEKVECRLMPWCDKNPGMAPGTECYAAGKMSLA
jgi:hypothetical protein